MNDPARVVFDCNTLLQALSSPRGPAGRCMQLAIDGKVRLFISAAVIAELRGVANRPKLIVKLKLTPERVEEFIEVVETSSTLLEEIPCLFRFDRDPADAHYVNLAIAANAKLIVSRDRDLLDLMDATKADGAGFRLRFPSLMILNPVEFLALFPAVP